MRLSLWRQLGVWLYDHHLPPLFAGIYLKLSKRAQCPRCCSHKKRVFQVDRYLPSFPGKGYTAVVQCKRCRGVYPAILVATWPDQNSLALLTANALPSGTLFRKDLKHSERKYPPESYN